MLPTEELKDKSEREDTTSAWWPLKPTAFPAIRTHRTQ